MLSIYIVPSTTLLQYPTSSGVVLSMNSDIKHDSMYMQFSIILSVLNFLQD